MTKKFEKNWNKKILTKKFKEKIRKKNLKKIGKNV